MMLNSYGIWMLGQSGKVVTKATNPQIKLQRQGLTTTVRPGPNSRFRVAFTMFEIFWRDEFAKVLAGMNRKDLRVAT